MSFLVKETSVSKVPDLQHVPVRQPVYLDDRNQDQGLCIHLLCHVFDFWQTNTTTQFVELSGFD